MYNKEQTENNQTENKKYFTRFKNKTNNNESIYQYKNQKSDIQLYIDSSKLPWT
jgi:hypothetical protein